MPLSDEIVKASVVPDDKTQLKLSDGGGLYLLVKNSGRYWKLAYRFDGKQKSLAFGVYPAVSLDEARLKRDKAKQLLSQSIDPGLVKKQQKLEQRMAPVITATNLPKAEITTDIKHEPVVLTKQYDSVLGNTNPSVTEERRLHILQIIAESEGYKTDENELQKELDKCGYKVSFDRIRTDIAWLYEQQVISIKTETVWLVHLSRSGLDVVASRMWVPGIKRPEL